ncbi:molybdate transport system substrate-binding protein [Pelagimonas varians]|uniref:Molybdate-binding periplasmic protein n=2 Tax=Pelagimonas varians TaxID=696760 RepID=A0A238L6S6_9RHOB|nr:molybdate transport system substrate-binding protein [Pelagimonas varians]SMX50006.1 Molybdate-binding periplasmic protein precursor [Pelagimonas varians]
MRARVRANHGDMIGKMLEKLKPVRSLRGWLSALVMMLFFSASSVCAETITIFAAASLKNALDEVAAEFDTVFGHDTTVSYAGSSALARQIQLGAPADIFISANPDWVDFLEQKEAVIPESRIDFLGNELVLISHDPVTNLDWQALDLLALLNGGRLAMALVQSVPAGIYGKASLQSLGQWDAIVPYVAQVDNVRAALALVALGEAPFGIVYATDARADPRVHVAVAIPAQSHRAIVYPAIAVTHSETAHAFLAHLQSSQARAIFERHGFSVLVE